MHRPCFLVIDREFPGSISTRKLVIETAKFNVITAYSGVEALGTMSRFPAIDGVVLDSALADMSCAEVIGYIKEKTPTCPIVLIQAPNTGPCPGADFYLDSYDPANLLTILMGLRPKDTDEVAQGEAAAVVG